MATCEEAIQSAGRKLAESNRAIGQMTAREQAEAAWSPTSRSSVTELEDLIRLAPGLPPLDRS